MRQSKLVSEMISKAGKLFNDSKFIKQCMLQAASLLNLGKKGQFINISLSVNTVAEHIFGISGHNYDQLREKLNISFILSCS